MGAAGIGTINAATTGQVTPGSAISGGPGSTVGLAPDPLPAGTPPAMLTANAYMLGTAAQGNQNPFGIVDLNSGAFTLIGNMGSGGYDGLAVANGVLYTEQAGTALFGQHGQRKPHPHRRSDRHPQSRHFRLNHYWTLRAWPARGQSEVATLYSINPQTGAITTIGPIGAGAIPDGQTYYR